MKGQNQKNIFEEVKKTVSKQKRWRVAREMVVGFFSFAKLRLYKDLNDESWPDNRKFSEHQSIQDILLGRDKSENEKVLYSEEYNIDEAISIDGLPLILDADSSQHSAIIDVVKNGKNLVIEGPPGTGKSQTITNIISAALHEGKNILFVAEKKAALEVVRKRLDILGLGDFCLELHSHKAQKGQLHADLSRRLSMKYTDVKVLDHEINDYCKERDKLIEYYNLLHENYSRSHKTIYEIFWATERWKQEIQNNSIDFSIENALNLTRDQINNCANVLNDFLSSYKELPKSVIDVWNGFIPEMLLPGDEDFISNSLLTFQNKNISFQNFLEENISFCGEKILKNNISFLKNISEIVTDYFVEKPNNCDHDLLINFLNKEVICALEDLSEMIDREKVLINQIPKNIHFIFDWNLDDIHSLKEALIKVINCGYLDQSLGDLQALVVLAKSTGTLLEDFIDIPKKINHLLPEPPQKIKDYIRINNIHNLLKDAPQDIQIYCHAENVLEIAESFYERAYEENKTFLKYLEAQSIDFNIDQIPSHILINKYIINLKDNNTFIKRMFNKEYKKVKKEIYQFLNDKKIFRSSDFFERLIELKNILHQIDEYNANEEYIRILGPLYKGIKTDWDRLKNLITWSRKLSNVLESENKAKLFLTNFIENRESLILIDKKIRELWNPIKSNLYKLKIEIKGNQNIIELNHQVKTRLDYINNLLQSFPVSEEINKYSLKELISAIEDRIKLAGLYRAIKKDENRYKKYFSDWYQKFDTEIQSLNSMASWVLCLKNECGMEINITQWILTEDVDKRLSFVNELVRKCKNYIQNLNIFSENMRQHDGSFNIENWIGNTLNKTSPQDLNQKVINAIDHCNYLIAWSDYCNLKKKADTLGLSPILDVIEDGTFDTGDAIAQFYYTLYQSMSKNIVRENPILGKFKRVTYDNIRSRLNKLDQSIKNRSRQRIAFRIAQRPIPYGVSSGYVRDYTERSLIMHEISKKKRHIPIRQLIARSSNALLAMKPCFMMSPQSVAQYLRPDQTVFDLIVMDEASQLRLEDALGAIARGNQLVVVGDPK